MIADIYHAGLLMYRALNGDDFYASQIPADLAVLEAKISSGKFPDRKKFMPHVPARLRTLVRKALQVNPADRFQTATEMADALSRVSLALDWSVEPLLLGGFRWRAATCKIEKRKLAKRAQPCRRLRAPEGRF
jgi:serine/threonine protein kinase